MKVGCEGLCLNRPIRVAGAIEGSVDVKRDGVVNGDALEGGHGISGGGGRVVSGEGGMLRGVPGVGDIPVPGVEDVPVPGDGDVSGDGDISVEGDTSREDKSGGVWHGVRDGIVSWLVGGPSMIGLVAGSSGSSLSLGRVTSLMVVKSVGPIGSSAVGGGVASGRQHVEWPLWRRFSSSPVQKVVSVKWFRHDK